MNKIKSILCLSLCVGTALSAVPMVANAEEESDLVYGTMDIPYAEFYANEGIGYEVDAVASATTSKWNSDSLVPGTYRVGNEDGTGTILGVTYYVALTNETLEALGEDNYNFTEIDSVPEAYKEVTITEDGVEFSAVVGDTTSVSASTTISTSTVWGDYLLEVTADEDNALSSDTIGTLYGVVLSTTDGDNYALRHLENIWRGEFAWSCGVVTVEAGGNTLSYENFVSLSGSTIGTITYITDKGYYVVDTDLYVPIKFTYTLDVAETSAGSGSTTITSDGVPEDYALTYSIDGLDATVDDNTITFENALPGQYTLAVEDADGKYAPISTTFILTTDTLPVTVENGALVKTDDATDEEFANFIANISSYDLNGTTYKATGHGAVSLLNDDGTVNVELTSGRGDSAVKIFEDGEYTLVVTAYGFSSSVEMSFTVSDGVIVDDNNGDDSEPAIGASYVTSIRGDVNLDGKVDGLDLVLLKKYILGLI